ncbi:cysteine rich repeat-containing protein [Rhodoplanes sp. SY1]|uniref:cysteine rich repeat-containing protein n=1 Tax=Rhodoplanes sp. SY1 TaxID=3166646 RepID=UPI0038B57969
MRIALVPAAAGLAILLALGAAPTPALAQSSQDQMACQFDAQTYCQEAIPDHGKVYRCLKRNARKISPACRAAISKGKAPRRNRPGTAY